MWGATHSYKAQVLRHILPWSIFNTALATKRREDTNTPQASKEGNGTFPAGLLNGTPPRKALSTVSKNNITDSLVFTNCPLTLRRAHD